MTTLHDPIYDGHRYPAEIISYAVWLYLRFPLSLRMVEEMLAARGIAVTHETANISAEVNGLCVHSLRATAATNALSHDSDIAKVQEWLGHANVSTTRLYDRRKSRPADSPAKTHS